MEKVRQRAVDRLRATLGDHPSPDEYAASLERAIWNSILATFPPSERYWSNPKVPYRYTHKVLSIAFNVTNPKNPGLRARVTDGRVSAPKLARMHPYDMFPELWSPIFERVARRQLGKQLTTDVETASDGAFQCKKCKSMKTTFTQLQTRAADEPMTTFVLCINCGKRWKE